jgi:hypothetical protein
MSTVVDKLKNIKLTPSKIMGTAGALGLASGLFKASADNKNATMQQEALLSQSEYSASERVRQAKKLQEEQTVGYLKSGVLLSGTPEMVIQETADYAMEDVRQIFKQRDIQSRMIEQQRKTSAISSIFGGLGKGLYTGYYINQQIFGKNTGKNPQDVNDPTRPTFGGAN